MSYYLKQLIDQERLAACLANAAALLQPQEQPMKHPVHMGRVFADMEPQDESACEEYEFTIIRFGRATESRKQWFPNSSAANLEAAALSFGGAVVMVQATAQVNEATA